jgi:hypothetical protein
LSQIKTSHFEIKIRNIITPEGFLERNSLSQISTLEEVIPAQRITGPGRGDLSSSRLEEHLQATAKRLKKLGVRPGVCIASVLPAGPDATTAEMIANRADANFVSLDSRTSRERYQFLLAKFECKLLLLPSGAHPAREAARHLGIPIANVLRHFEAGIFTLEADVAPQWAPAPPPPPAWKKRGIGTPLVLIAPSSAYRRLANRLDAVHPVIGITPPSLEHLPQPHTFEHIAAECVRILRRCRPHGPYALAGWRTDSLVALEMARLLEEAGDKVVLVAMLDASSLFHRFRFPFLSWKRTPPADLMADALRQYHPRPWFGKILHLSPAEPSNQRHASLSWRSIAPQGIASYEAPAEMLSEPNVQFVATILAAELLQKKA